MPTDEERMKAYNECRAANAGPMNALGLDFVFKAITGNFPAAVIVWLKMVKGTDQFPKNCFDFLSPEQQKSERIRMQEERDQKLYDKGPR